MHSAKTDGQQWSIKAEFTVSPQGICIPEKNCSNTVQDESGIRLSYCWKSNENTNIATTAHYRSTRNDLCKPIEYHKGSLTFTSTPPCRLHAPTSGGNFEYHDSGYGSDLMSLNSLASGISQSPNSSNNRKCRSTCNIILCSNVCDSTDKNSAISSLAKCEQKYSLHCPTPVLQSLRRNTNVYGYEDFYCQHINSGKSKKFASGELNDTELQRATTNTPLLVLPFRQVAGSADFKPYKKDVSIQTSDSLQKCSITNLKNTKKAKLKMFEKTHPSNFNHNCYKPGQCSLSTRDGGENLQVII